MSRILWSKVTKRTPRLRRSHVRKRRWVRASSVSALPGPAPSCGPRRRRRRCGASGRGRTSIASGKSSETPAPPCTWIARSMTHVASSAAATLIAEISMRALLLADRVHHPRGLQGEEAGLLDPHPRLGDPVPDDALLRRAGCRTQRVSGLACTSARGRARPCRSLACSDGSARARAEPVRSGSRPPRSPKQVGRPGTRTSSNSISQCPWPTS